MNKVPAVSASNVCLQFGDVHAVKNVCFELEEGRFLTVLGPSGSGKTTLLRLIAGFQQPDQGEIFIKGQTVRELAPNKRSIGMVFQRLALFPHMTAAENVAFPLKMRRFNARTISDRVKEYLHLVRLEGLGSRRINELSGGQQQRVAIARALVFEPDLLLLDEPLAALDRKLREEMQLEFRRIQKELGVTTINVTHDQREALVVSDQIIVMNHGEIQQNATPLEVYRSPSSPFVANFVGVTNLFHGTLESLEGQQVAIRISQQTLLGTSKSENSAPTQGVSVQAAIRAEQIRLFRGKSENRECEAYFEGRVTDVIFEGERILYELSVAALSDALIRIIHHDQQDFSTFEVGEMVFVGWQSRDMHVFVVD